MGQASLINFGTGLAARIAPGQGDKVMWIHGYTLDSSSWASLWDLLPHWYHIGIDLPGHGASLPLYAGEDLSMLAQRIGILALQQDVRHLVALSFGTVVALQITIEFPTSFSSMILGAPALGGGPQDEQVKVRYQELMDSYRRFGFGPQLRERWMQSPPNIFHGAEGRPQLWEQLWQLVGRHAWWELGDASYSRLSSYPQTESQLQKVEAATLLCVGENDLDTFKRCAELIHRSIPACKQVNVPDVGHLCMLENPTQIYTTIDHHLRATRNQQC